MISKVFLIKVSDDILTRTRKTEQQYGGDLKTITGNNETLSYVYDEKNEVH